MPRILIIDDNKEFRDLLRAALEREGHTVEEAADGEEGIKAYKQSIPDLVVTDMIMPVKEGLETMIELRKEYPDVKIIAVSGDGFEEPMTYLDGAELLGGALRTFVKPFNIEEFLQAVEELTRGR
ncbi:MAG: response regulator [Candidatus Omnitrophica bacterium]|nr:response regulator [Candidatus Omnitrophota bacterium]